MIGCEHRGCLQVVLDRRHPPDDRFGELADPPIGDEPDRDGVEVVVLLAADAAGLDQAGLLEDIEVAHHAEARHRGQGRRELAEGLSVAIEQPVEEQAPARITESPEDRRQCRPLPAQ